ncbi:MAG TPA: M23 family metallopeptidase [Methylomirabilota bacterium]|nr:M23 family metallopeptidase [Methylomirabilota bacterium]
MPRRSRVKLGLLLLVVLVLAVMGGVSYLIWRQFVPGVRVTGAPPRAVGTRTSVKLLLEAARGNVAGAELRLVQGDAVTVVNRYEGQPAPRLELAATLAPGADIKEGAGRLEVWAGDDFWRPLPRTPRAAASYPVVVDFTPPKLEIIANTRYVAPGGAGLVVLRAGDATRADIRVGTFSFPTFAYGPPGTRVGLFALPHNFAGGSPLTVNALDEAGNTAARGIATEVLPRRFRRDTIDVSEALLQVKVPELLPQHPAGQPLVDGFLVINRDQRRQAEEEKRRLARGTADRPLWNGAFVQPKNTKVFSNFAETRTYRYQGRTIDTQIHFGYDLASTKQAAVPAANTGVVLFAGPLTIYGNAVIIDHGLGLMTLYGHLSSIAVKVGDQVARGQQIGRTGTTGLATGDHLHYEVLVHGISVTPLEWWDAKWIRDRIGAPLASAGVTAAAAGSR